MKLYCGIDLHSNNHYVSIIDREDKRLKEKRLNNDLSKTITLLEPYQNDLQGIAIESSGSNSSLLKRQSGTGR